MIEIDGSYLEGGGQILRTALALSAITGKAFKATKIRAGRPKPGLQPQHLACVKAVKEICNAFTSGAELGSMELEFVPRAIKPGSYSFDIGTAGSVTLLLQAILPVAISAKGDVKLKVTGGTDVPYSQPADYFLRVLLPHLKPSADIDAKIMRRGYYPAGGGRIELRIHPLSKLQVQLTERGKLLSISGVSHASGDLQKPEVADRQARAARVALGSIAPLNIESQYCNTLSTGSGITLWATFVGDASDRPVILGADSLGSRGKSSEQVGEEAARNLLKEIQGNAVVDSHLADQLLLFMALAGKGELLTSEITDHTRTNMHIIEKFLAVHFHVDGNVISCSE